MNALDSFHFKIVDSPAQITASEGDFFAPKYLYWLLGEQERIMGYEGLAVHIYLSARRLIPYIEITYTSKAPSFAKIDDIAALLEKHYGKVYSDKSEFEKCLGEEKTLPLPGTKLK